MEKDDILAFQRSIGITFFSRAMVSLHNTMLAVWDILTSPWFDGVNFKSEDGEI